MAQKVQVEAENCTEEILKRQGEKAAQLNGKINNLQDEELNKSQVHDVTLIQDTSRNVKIENLQSELLEEINVTQVKEVTLIQDKTSNIQISPTQADHGIVNEGTNEKTGNCKNIYLFRKSAYTFRIARKDTTLYMRDKFISYNKVTKYKKCRKLEWCINVKKR
jgi:hypothetical protein